MYIVQKNININIWAKPQPLPTVLEGGFFCSVGKNKARKFIINDLIKRSENGEKVKMLELGIGKDATFHKMVKAQAPLVTIKSVDDGRNLKNIKQLKKMSKENPDLIINSFYQFAKQGLETFSDVWMDYCGPWTNRVAKDIKMATRVMQGSGKISFTLLEAREHVQQLGLKKGATREEIDNEIEKALMKAFSDAELKVTLIKEIQYRSAPQRKGRNPNITSNMRVLVFKYKKI